MRGDVSSVTSSGARAIAGKEICKMAFALSVDDGKGEAHAERRERREKEASLVSMSLLQVMIS